PRRSTQRAGSTPATSPWSTPTATRSEEHTSELQSHLNLVCRLLLVKKDRRCHARHGRDPARPPFRKFLLRGRVATALCCTPWFAVFIIPRQTAGIDPFPQRRVFPD